MLFKKHPRMHLIKIVSMYTWDLASSKKSKSSLLLGSIEFYRFVSINALLLCLASCLPPPRLSLAFISPLSLSIDLFIHLSSPLSHPLIHSLLLCAFTDNTSLICPWRSLVDILLSLSISKLVVQQNSHL